MLETEDSRIINNWLSKFKIPLRSEPLFKLSWSEDLYELRNSEWPIYSGPIIVGHYSGVKLAKKYNFIKDRWLIEQWMPPEIVFDVDLPESKNGDYACIYVFESAAGQSLPLKLKVAQIVINHALMPKESYTTRLLKHMNDLEEKENRAAKADLEILNDESYLVSQFHSGSAILNAFDKNKK
jgi:hypothetical protein